MTWRQTVEQWHGGQLVMMWALVAVGILCAEGGVIFLNAAHTDRTYARYIACLGDFAEGRYRPSQAWQQDLLRAGATGTEASKFARERDSTFRTCDAARETAGSVIVPALVVVGVVVFLVPLGVMLRATWLWLGARSRYRRGAA